MAKRKYLQKNHFDKKAESVNVTHLLFDSVSASVVFVTDIWISDFE